VISFSGRDISECYGGVADSVTARYVGRSLQSHTATPDSHEDTSSDDERFEKEQLAQDRDATGIDTADVDDTSAQRLVNDLVDADIVTPVPEDHVLVHEPSGTAFDSSTQLALYHRGWIAGRDADAEGE
jgi:hypothetical protein